MDKSKCLENIDLKRFCFPPLELLQDFDDTTPQNGFTYEETMKSKIKDTFVSFQIYVKNISYIRGGLVTRFEVELEDMNEISKINNNQDEISLSLNNSSIIVPIPGTPKIWI